MNLKENNSSTLFLGLFLAWGSCTDLWLAIHAAMAAWMARLLW
jgi:hypothetical protein